VPATNWAAASNRGGLLFQGRSTIAGMGATGGFGIRRRSRLMQAASVAATPAQASSVALDPNPSQ
jgi:hypothetical protein